MAIYLDTSILVRFVSPDDPHHEAILSVVTQRAAQGETFVFSPQAVRESWAVLTRPISAGGYGLAPTLASSLIQDLHQVFQFVDDQAGTHRLWRQLVEEHGVSGKQVHDANHVAFMLANGLVEVLTLDDRDFQRYHGIRVHKPKLL